MMGKTIAVLRQTNVLWEMETVMIMRIVKRVYVVAVIIVLGRVIGEMAALPTGTIAAIKQIRVLHHPLHQF